MLEVPTNARHAKAIRLAHAERARVFAKVFGAIFNTKFGGDALPSRHPVAMSLRSTA